jgi:hypothetical protein
MDGCSPRQCLNWWTDFIYIRYSKVSGEYEYGTSSVVWYSKVHNVSETGPVSEEHCLLGYDVVQSVESQPAFRKNLSPPYSGWKNKRKKNQRARRRHTPVSSSAYSSILNMEAMFLRNVG